MKTKHLSLDPMNVITKRTIVYYSERYPSAKTALLNWFLEFSKYHFQNLNQLKQVYRNASIVANHRVIFNIKANDFRLIVSVNFTAQSAYIIWFGTHSEYNHIDAAMIKHIDI